MFFYEKDYRVFYRISDEEKIVLDMEPLLKVAFFIGYFVGIFIFVALENWYQSIIIFDEN